MPDDSRPYCQNHRYFEGKRWRTYEEADAQRKSHIQEFSEDPFEVEIEQQQTSGVLRTDLLNQKFFIHSALSMLSDSATSDPEEIGACTIKLPTGEERCYQLSQQQCNQLGGEYKGGDC